VNRWTGRLVLTFGAGLVCAGVLVADPLPGTASTWHGSAHNIASIVVFASLAAACFTAVRWRSAPGWRRYCVATGAAVPVLFVVSGAVSGTTGLWQRVTIVVGWTWLIVLELRGMRALTGSGTA
jgi:uncharacterized protein DUF998